MRTTVRIGAVERDVEFTLTSRSPMTYRMLLGRKALVGFHVDPARRYLAKLERVRKKKKTKRHP